MAKYILVFKENEERNLKKKLFFDLKRKLNVSEIFGTHESDVKHLSH